MSPPRALVARRGAPRARGARKLIIGTLLFHATLAALIIGPQRNEIECSSSYLYDHILPTAKVALNKIRGSFSPQQQEQQQQDLAASSATQTQTPSPTTTTETNNNNNNQDEQPTSGENENGRGPAVPSGDWTRPRAPAAVATEQVAQEEEEGAGVPSSGGGPGEFVRLDVRPAGDNKPASAPLDEDGAPQTTVVSTTEFVSEDPTTRATTEEASRGTSGSVTGVGGGDGGGGELPAATRGQDSNEQQQTPAGTSTATEQRQQEAAVSRVSAVSEPAVVEITSPPTESNQIETTGDQRKTTGGGVKLTPAQEEAAADEVRATELEAIAALDATMGFGGDATLWGATTGGGASNSNSQETSTSTTTTTTTTTDACYDEYGNARYCEPEFENVALERQVEVSSECGHPPSRFCTTYLNEHGDQIRNCHICDAAHPKKRHPAAYLTDANQPAGNPTCWVSAPISAAPAAAALGGADNSTSAASATESQQRDNVTLTLNLEKRYELTYVALQFCSLKPDSLAIWRSADFGASWSPYQFYSSACERTYGRPAVAAPVSSTSTSTTSSSSKQVDGDQVAQIQRPEATCVNTSGPAWAAAAGRIAFSTLDKAANAAAPSDWTTATNIRIVLDRHQASWIQSSLAHAHHSHHQLNQRASRATSSVARNEPAQNNMKLNGTRALDVFASQETSLTSPSDTYNYALSDLTLGGRCKCNGHASRCLHSPDTGKLQCDCQHNTDGPDCERCLPLHHDRPWQRATAASANPCQPCNCNGHSRKCRFDPELYALSGKRSGGVCIDCRDNTTGRHCNYCKEGYTRDHSRPMSDKFACKPCDCHPVGSVGRACNQTSGQCPCKEGVTGLECTRCAPGYQQSSSPSEPCIRLPENDINFEPTIEQLDPDDDGGGGQESRAAVANSVQVMSHHNHQPLSGDQATAEETPAVQVADELAISMRAPEVAAQTTTSTTTTPRTNDNAEDPDPVRPPHANNRHRQAQPPAYRHHYQWQQHPYAGGNPYRSLASKPPAAYRGRHQFSAEGAFAAESPPYEPQEGDRDEQDVDQPDDDYHHRQSISHPRQLYGAPPPSGSQQSFSGGGGGGGFRHVARPRLQPVASLDNGPSGEGEGDTGEGQEAGYGMGPMLGAAIYPQQVDEMSFNQIHLPPPPPVPRRAQHLQRNNLARSRGGHSQGSSGGRRFQTQQADFEGYDPMPAVLANQHHTQYAAGRGRTAAHSLTCADCQAATRRLKFKRFCHLDYAVRATVLAKQVGPDWTRFDVEIQDIFKSPLTASVTGAARDHTKRTVAQGGKVVAAAAAAAVDLIQTDEGLEMSANQTQTQNQKSPPLGDTSSNGEQQANNQQQQLIVEPQRMGQPAHRLKIGSTQSVWIPTEDVACKCPRLKLRASYLLMGLVDTRENSATSIQLDRHGVAMEWKPSHQEKLIAYQRRQSKGRC